MARAATRALPPRPRKATSQPYRAAARPSVDDRLRNLLGPLCHFLFDDRAGSNDVAAVRDHGVTDCAGQPRPQIVLRRQHRHLPLQVAQCASDGSIANERNAMPRSRTARAAATSGCKSPPAPPMAKIKKSFTRPTLAVLRERGYRGAL